MLSRAPLSGGWTEGDDPLEYLTEPEPLGGPGSAPKPDPALFGTYSTVQDLKGTVKSKARSATRKATKEATRKTTKKAAKKSSRASR